MSRRFWIPTTVFLVAFAPACARKPESAGTEAVTPTAAAASEKTYAFRGKIVSRDPAKGTLTVDHEKVEGLWEAMTMGFEVRGADLASLPPDGARIQATLHVENGRYWLTDVRPE
jgi:Cu/Ag efflux protein CusF